MVDAARNLANRHDAGTVIRVTVMTVTNRCRETVGAWTPLRRPRSRESPLRVTALTDLESSRCSNYARSEESQASRVKCQQREGKIGLSLCDGDPGRLSANIPLPLMKENFHARGACEMVCCGRPICRE